MSQISQSPGTFIHSKIVPSLKSNIYSLLGPKKPTNSTQMFMGKFVKAFEILSRSLLAPVDEEALLIQEPIIRRIYILLGSFDPYYGCKIAMR